MHLDSQGNNPVNILLDAQVVKPEAGDSICRHSTGKILCLKNIHAKSVHPQEIGGAEPRWASADYRSSQMVIFQRFQVGDFRTVLCNKAFDFSDLKGRVIIDPSTFLGTGMITDHALDIGERICLKNDAKCLFKHAFCRIIHIGGYILTRRAGAFAGRIDTVKRIKFPAGFYG